MGAPVASNMLPEKENCTQDFLNAGQYKRNGILRYERVFGHTFVSTGGLTTTKQIVDPIGLKPGGKLVISEYVHGRNHPNHTTEYVEYIKDRGYQLVTVQEYGNVLKKVGFRNVQAIDKTAEFIGILKMEMDKFKPTKDKFIREFSLKDYKDLTEGWDIKVERCSKGEQGCDGLQLAKN